MPTSVYRLRIHLGPDGYFIMDEDGEAADPGRFRTWVAAAARLNEMEGELIEARRQELEDGP